MHWWYAGVLAACLLSALLLEPVLHVNVLRRWRRLIAAITPGVVIFTGWDAVAIHTGQWSFDARQLTGVVLPGHLPIEELAFFVVVPVCAVLAFEAVRAVKRDWRAGDEEA